MIKNISSLAMIIALTLILVGCGGQSSQQPSPMANQEAALRTPPIQPYPVPAVKSEGSLFSDDVQADLFTDVKAAQVGDIITINVVETSKASKNAQTNLGRSSEVDASVTALLGLEGYQRPLFDEDIRLSTGIKGSYDSSFKGKGKTTRTENMTAQISARVLQVLPNGNLVIRGSREITVNYEKQLITIQGVIRPADVTPENTIQSNYIADAKIEYIGKGDVSRQQRQGWLTRILDYVWPF